MVIDYYNKLQVTTTKIRCVAHLNQTPASEIVAKCFLKCLQRSEKKSTESINVQKNHQKVRLATSMRCSFKFPVKVGVEESIVNAPLV
jgi:hypothetical protein